jgi:hypothetical protein
MNDSKPRKPVFGHKGTLPGSAGRYSMSSRPPKSTDRPELGERAIPGPGRVPQEALEEAPKDVTTLSGQRGPESSPVEQSVDVARQASPTTGSDWKGSTIGGWGTEVPRGGTVANLRTTYGLGTPGFSPKDDSASGEPPRFDEAPGTIRGTPPPPGPSTTPPADAEKKPFGGVAARRISIPDTENVRAPQPKTTSTLPPDSPNTQRGVPPAPGMSQKPPVRLIEVEPVRMGVTINSTLPPGLMPVCEEIGSGSAGNSEVSLLTSAPAAKTGLYLGAIAIARRMAQVLPGQVVLVETDFETPILASTLGVTLQRGRGFSEQLHARAWGGESGRWHLANPGLGFDMLCESRIRTPGLLWSDQFAHAIATLRTSYSIVLLIAPNRMTAVDHRALDDVTSSVYGISTDGNAVWPAHLVRSPLTRKVRLASPEAAYRDNP